MKKFIRLAGAAAFAAAAGIAAGPGNAAPPAAKFKHPHLKHGVLTIKGTNASDKIALRLKAGNTAILEVDVGDDGSANFSFEARKIATIIVDAGAGDDLVRVDEANGSFADAIPTTIDGEDGNDDVIGGSGAETLRGSAGDDTLVGGSGASTLDGGAGDDTITGGQGSDTLLGGDGNDLVNGGRGNDVAFLGSGDDTFVWNPGDGSDTVEGQAGADTMQFNGSNAGEKVDLSANGSRLRLFRDVGNITMDTAGVERVNVAALGGADLVTVNDLSGTDVDKVNVDLGAAGGGDGQPDHVVVNGTNDNDTIGLSGDASGVTVSGLQATVTIQHQEAANDQLAVNPVGGADLVIVKSLTGPEVTKLNVDLAGAPGGSGDGRQDSVVVNGSDANDTINVAGDATGVTVSAPQALVTIEHQDAATDELAVNSLAGDDAISATTLAAQAIALTLDGGAGDDTITGGQGSDTLFGGDGNDSINGGRGSDVAFMGSGDDTFVWNPGDGSDIVEGQDGADTMQFNGSNAGEKIDLSTNGSRLRLFRDVGNITMDTAGVERVNVAALGGADLVTVNDLSGTDVRNVSVDLGASGAGDGQADQVVVNGTNSNDRITASGSNGSANVTGLAATVNVTDAEPANDTLTINALGGDDAVDASALAASAIQLVVDGGTGNDHVAGGSGPDVLGGGDGNDSIDGNGGADVAFLGSGDDTFVWDPGDGSDIVEGQAGIDTMRFNGSNASENIDLSANGSRLRLFRDVGNITMDTNGVEQVDVNAAGNADTVSVNDLTGTDVGNVHVDLGAGDGQPDHVIVTGTNGSDTVAAAGSNGTSAVTGLAAAVNVTNAESANDTLTINTVAGADTVDASNLAATAIKLELNGGDDADVLTGSAGNDLVNGGRGNDVAFLGAGDDTFVWNPGDGSDTVEGQAGHDTMLFNGSNASEQIDFSANGSRFRLFRDVGNITMDTDGVEQVDLKALGGADKVTVNDLTGTDVGEANIDLGAGAAGDGQPDHVIVNATNGADAIAVTGSNGAAGVAGLAAAVNVTNAEPATDTLTINGVDGDDVIDASGLAANAIALTLDGGAGDDVLIGGAGNDILFGGDGDDVLIGGPGHDVLDGGPGNNILIQD